MLRKKLLSLQENKFILKIRKGNYQETWFYSLIILVFNFNKAG